MKWIVKAFVGRKTFTWTWLAAEKADANVRALLDSGIRSRSRAGVFTIYPPHRLNRITVRQVKA